jgi:hypothetical protein
MGERDAHFLPKKGVRKKKKKNKEKNKQINKLCCLSISSSHSFRQSPASSTSKSGRESESHRGAQAKTSLAQRAATGRDIITCHVIN